MPATPNSPSNPPASPSGPSNPSTPAATFSVASISPAPGATQVALNTTIQITFSSDANASTVNATDIKVTSPQPVPGTVSYDSSSKTAKFTPSAALAPSSTYTVTVNGVSSSSGTSMTGPFTSRFATVTASASSGSPSAPVLQYEASLIQGTTVVGSISVDTTGTVSVQFSGATASQNFALQFCPTFYSKMELPPNCFSVGSFAADSSGKVNASIKFPKSGSWAGDFQVNSGTTPESSTGLNATTVSGSSSEVYQAALQPMTTVNGAALTSGTQAPLTSGSVVYSKGTLQFTLSGASPGTTYTSTENALALGGSYSYVLATAQKQSAFTTDSKGNISFTVLQDGIFGDIFTVEPQNNTVGYVGGFSVPK